MSYEKDTILNYLRKIHEKDLILPAIQRDFVWDEEHIYRLLDSIFRNYPFGTLLFWNTKQRVQFREFVPVWFEDQRYTYDIKPEGKKATLVLDGQQRLQSLYIAIYGGLENKKLYFDLFSGVSPEDISQTKFSFQFFTAAQAESENREKAGNVYWVPLSEIANIEDFSLLMIKIQQYLLKLGLSAEAEKGKRLSTNVAVAFHSLKSDPLLNFYIVDKEYGDDGRITNLDEILEIFVRVNSGGQVLSKSDLMFSLMHLKWEAAPDEIMDVIEKLNKKGRFNIDKDFILKCSLVCVGEGAKYEVNKFRKEETIEKIHQEFPKISHALDNCLDFVVNTCRFLDDRILRSYNTLIPFVYFFYLQPSQDIRGENVRMNMNQALYLSLMTAVYSRFADSYIDHVVNKILVPAQKSNPGIFPLESYRHFIYEKRQKDVIDDSLLQANLPLLMNILERGRVLPEGKRSRVPEYDHIFPKSKLRDQGYLDNLINHYANIRLISAKDNNWKRDQDPKTYFCKYPNIMEYYLMPAGLLEYGQYKEFLEERRNKIWDKVQGFLGLSGSQTVERNHDQEPQQTLDQVVDEETVIRRVLERAPISKGQLALYKLLYSAGSQGMKTRELATCLSLTRIQFAGLMGALGRRIWHTPGMDKTNLQGIYLLFDIQEVDNEWIYRLRPIFRKILDEKQIF